MSNREAFLRHIDGLPEPERLALYDNPAAVKALTKRLAALSAKEFVHELDRSPGVIARLKAEAAFEGDAGEEISDELFPTSGTGIVPVRYRLIPGKTMKQADGLVYRVDAESRFREVSMRFPGVAEALLPVARDRELGRGDRPYVAFIHGAPNALSVCEFGGKRHLSLAFMDRHWVSRFDFVGVCEESF